MLSGNSTESVLKRAEKLIKEVLSDGAKASEYVVEMAKEKQISQRTLKTAKKNLEVKSIKQLEDAVRILEENIKSLLDENDQLKTRPDHFGRKSRASDEHRRLLKMHQYNQLSYQEISDKMTAKQANQYTCNRKR